MLVLDSLLVSIKLICIFACSNLRNPPLPVFVTMLILFLLTPPIADSHCCWAFVFGDDVCRVSSMAAGGMRCVGVCACVHLWGSCVHRCQWGSCCGVQGSCRKNLYAHLGMQREAEENRFDALLLIRLSTCEFLLLLLLLLLLHHHHHHHRHPQPPPPL